MNEFGNSKNQGFLLKDDYVDEKDAVGSSLSKKRRKMADSILGPKDLDKMETREETKDKEDEQ
jgi:hypothetical protein